MPELPEVETVRRGLQPVMEGARIVRAEARRKDLRFPFQGDFVARLQGQTVTGLGRRAKYLLADLGSGDVLLMHLGMSGSFRIHKVDEATTPGQFFAVLTAVIRFVKLLEVASTSRMWQLGQMADTMSTSSEISSAQLAFLRG